MDITYNGEFIPENIRRGQVVISYGLLHKLLNLKDDVKIINVYNNSTRQNVAHIILEGENMGRVSVGNLLPTLSLEDVQENTEDTFEF